MRRIGISFLILIFTLSSIFPSSILAASIDTMQENGDVPLYRVNEDILINEQILLKKGNYIFGYPAEEENKIKIQFGLEDIEIDKNKLEKIEEITKEEPEFIDITTYQVTVQHLVKGQSLLSPDNNKEQLGEIISEFEYPMTDDNLFVIGNVSYTLSNSIKKDESTNLETIDSDNTENVDDENIIDESVSIDEDSLVESDEKETISSEEDSNKDVQNEDDSTKDVEQENKVEVQNQKIVTSSIEATNGGFRSSDKYFKATKDLPVYDNSTGKLVVVGYLKEGEIYPRYESSPSWHMIQFNDGKYYVKKEGTVPVSGNSLKNINKNYKVTTDTITALTDVTVYDNSSGGLVPFGVIKEGQDYRISHDYGGNWIIIVFADRVGYIDSSEVKRNYYPQFGNYFRALDNVPVYDNRSGKLEVVGYLEKGQSYPRYEGSPQWHKIQFGDFQAFVHKENTAHSNGKDIKNKNNNKYKISARKIIALNDLTVYDNSSGNLVPMGTIKAGQTYSIVKDYGGEWIYVLFADRIGFVRSAEAKLDFLPSDKYFRVTEKHVKVFARKNGQLVEVGGLQKGHIYPRYEASPQWHMIQFGDYKAYVRKEHTEVVSGSSIQNELPKNHKYRDRFFVGAKRFFVPSKRDILVYDNNMKPFGIIKKGETYPIALDYGGSLIYVFFSDRVGLVKKEEVDLSGIKRTKYNYSFKQMVDAQVGRNHSDHLGKVLATRAELEFYTNPLNFPSGTPEFFQFLVLSRTAGLNANEINQKVLNSKAGSLAGQAQAFINAGKKFNINEAYLIAHALHETGNGSSELAIGIPVDKYGNVTRNSKGEIAKTSETKHYVYNMYGYGAYNHCPIDCGAKYAFEQGWFTIEDSIIGGAQSIVNYIKRGQDTLYKMKWNPENPGYPQYATHIQWATAQTKRLYDIYKLLTNYTAIFDVPEFDNMPDYKNTFGTVTASSLNFRNGPGTTYSSIGSIQKGTKIQLIGSDPTGWYKVKYDGKTGWVSAAYVTLIY